MATPTTEMPPHTVVPTPDANSSATHPAADTGSGIPPSLDLSTLHTPFFTNSLIGKSQASLSLLPSTRSGIPPSLSHTVLYAGARLAQMAGILLGMPQTTIAHAIVLYWRFFSNGTTATASASLPSSNPTTSLSSATTTTTTTTATATTTTVPALTPGGSLTVFSVEDVYPVCLIVASKVSHSLLSLRDVANVHKFLQSFNAAFATSSTIHEMPYQPDRFFVSDGGLDRITARWFELELAVLGAIGFDTTVALPHRLIIPYSRLLGLLDDPENGHAVIKRAWDHLNSALLNPQMVYLTHQPCALATAAIYLAARQIGVKMPGVNWWEVFDTDREELGFLVVAFLSFNKFAEQVAEEWKDRDVPTDTDALQEELARS